MDLRLSMLETKIRTDVKIPISIKNNLIFKTTGLGGIFLHYACNSATPLKVLNSKVSFKLMFDTGDAFNRYEGDICGLEVMHQRGIKCLRGIKQKQPYEKVVEKVNKWLLENEEFLYASIENKM